MQNCIVALFYSCFLITYAHGLNTAYFHELVQNSKPKWMEERIEKELAPFQKEDLRRDVLNEILEKFGDRAHLTLVSIRNSVVTTEDIVPNRLWTIDHVIRGIEKLNSIIELADLDLLITGCDTLPVNIGGLQINDLPIFVWSKKIEDSGGILIPDLMALRGYDAEKSLIDKGNTIYNNWDTKIETLFFRGTDSDGSFLPEAWPKCPRARIALLSQEYPLLINAKFFRTERGLHFTNMNRFAEDNHLFTWDWTSMEEYPRYKYLMDLDGTSASVPRLAVLLFSNSLVFKHSTDSYQWWYSEIKPYEHYIPVKNDLSDLLEQLEWAISHDTECRMISSNASKLASRILSEEAVYLYLYKLLKAYALIQGINN